MAMNALEMSEDEFRSLSSKTKTDESDVTDNDVENEIAAVSDVEGEVEDYVGSKASPTSERFEQEEVRDQSDFHWIDGRERVNEEYLELLNETIRNAYHQMPSTTFGQHELEPDQVGLTWYTSVNKARLLDDALARYGPYNLAQLQNTLPNHSTLEIKQYLHLLKTASDHHYLFAPADAIVKYPEILAAWELNDECNHALEQKADDVAAYQLDREESIERKRFADHWLLDSSTVLDLNDPNNGSAENLSRTANDNEPSQLDANMGCLRKAVDLLDLPTWLGVSESVFNNIQAAPVSIDGYKTENNQTNRWELLDTNNPSQYKSSFFASAFTDFHNIVVSTTRRLVQSTIFQAQSRLRATDAGRGHTDKQLEITDGDVQTALEILGMPRDSKLFWATAARRNSLHVFDYTPSGRADSRLYGRNLSRVRDLGDQLSYEEVEDRLGLIRPETGNITSDEDVSEMVQDGIDVALQGPHQPSDRTASSPILLSELDDRPYLAAFTEEDLYAAEQEQIAEYQDFYADVEAMHEVYWITDHSHIDSECELDKPDQRQQIPRPSVYDLVNWRDKMKYKPEWETYGYRVPFAELRVEINEKKRSWSQSRRRNWESNKRRRTGQPDEAQGSEIVEESSSNPGRGRARSAGEHESVVDGSRPQQASQPRRRTASPPRSRSKIPSPSESSSASSSEEDTSSRSSSLMSSRGRRSKRSSPEL